MQALRILRTNSENQDFVQLVHLLDQDLQRRDGADHPFFAQFNKIDSIKYVVVAYMDLYPVGCGAIKEYDGGTMEVKRMFVTPEHRGNGVATAVLKELELWTVELGFKKCILETGERQPEAIGLYAKNKYHRIPNYGQYANVLTSVCFSKELE